MATQRSTRSIGSGTHRKLLSSSALAALLSVGLVSAAQADVVIGDWENSTDGWIDWGTQAALTEPKYTYSTFGATRGNTALKLSQNGWNQNLSIKLQDTPGLRDAFYANKEFSLDFSAMGNEAVSGFQEVFSLAINAQGYGFVDQQPIPKQQFGFPNGNTQRATLTWSYAALVDGDAANGEIAPNADYIEFILATNGNLPSTEFYFDNARLAGAAIAGDFNRDGVRDAVDIDLLFKATTGPVPPANPIFDVNGDGQVNVGVNVAGSDADHWVKTLEETRYGDANLDQRVNFGDLVTLAQNYNKPTDATWSMGSFNGDGAVNFADLVLLAQNYNFAAPGAVSEANGFSADFVAAWASAQSAVPEPTSIAAIAIAAGALARRRKA